MSTLDFSTTNFTDKDFPALKKRLNALVKTLYPDWSDQDVLNFGNMMLDAYAFVGDVLNFYNDANYREAYVPTAQLLQSMIDLSSGMSVPLPLQERAYVDLTFSIEGGYPIDVRIPKNTTFSTSGEDSITFQTTTEVIVPASQTDNYKFSVENSLSVSQVIQSAETAWWTAWLDKIPFLEIETVTDDYGTWTKVDSLIDSNPNDRHFEVSVNANGRAKLRFGNGVIGKIPEGDLYVEYLIGGGAEGNVQKNTIIEINDVIKDTLGHSVSATVTNEEKASGGADRVTVEECRRLIPAGFSTQKRSVSNPDFVANALLVPGVSRALMQTSDEDPGIDENTGHLIIIPEGGGMPSTALKDLVYDQVTVNYPQTLTFKVFMNDPIYKNVNIYAKVYRNSDITEAEVSTNIRNNLEDFFAIKNEDGTVNERVNFGGSYKNANGETDSSLPYSDIYNEIRDTFGVRKLGTVTVNGHPTDLSLLAREFPVLGTITLIDGDTGNVI